jgi:hypothetical protein
VQLTTVNVVAGIWKPITTVGFWLPSVAVMVAEGVMEPVNAPVVAEKPAVLCPANTVTLAGTVSATLLLCSVTVVLDVAAWFRVTVQADEEFAPIMVGVQPTDISIVAAGICNVMVNVGLWLPSVAVTIADAVLLEVRVPVVAEKVALLCPDNTITLVGTLSAALPLLTAIGVLAAAF